MFAPVIATLSKTATDGESLQFSLHLLHEERVPEKWRSFNSREVNMGPTEQPRKPLAWDAEEDQKRWVFERVNELARKRNVAVLYIYSTMTDYGGGGWTDLQLHYDGPKPTPDMCLFCGKPTVEGDHGDDSGGFVIHHDCYDESVNDWGMDFYLKAGPHRPAVIVIVGYFPGSIDNLIMGVAWGLGVHYLVYQRHLPSSEEASETANVFARRLVRQIQMPRILRMVN